MDNQRNYQALFRCEASRLEPFLGVILGPFDVALPAPLTAVTLFSVQQRSSQLVPYNIR
jgi:protein MYSM1